jgi:hypothetical protein
MIFTIFRPMVIRWMVPLSTWDCYWLPRPAPVTGFVFSSRVKNPGRIPIFVELFV